MFFQQKTLEEKIKELEIQNEAINEEVQTLLQELNVTPEQLTAFIENEDHFTQDNWKELQKQKEKLDEKLQTTLQNIRNPKKTKAQYQSLNVQHHWLPVK